jgi:hypothetical protein
MNSEFVDLSGQRFGRLLVKSYHSKTEHRQVKYLVECDHADMTRQPKQLVVMAQNLRNGKTTSCGCWQKESVSSRTKHIEDAQHWENEYQRALEMREHYAAQTAKNEERIAELLVLINANMPDDAHKFARIEAKQTAAA